METQLTNSCACTIASFSSDECFAFALRTHPDEGFQKLSLDCFVASLPRNDGVDGPTETASSAKLWSLAHHYRETVHENLYPIWRGFGEELFSDSWDRAGRRSGSEPETHAREIPGVFPAHLAVSGRHGGLRLVSS